MGVQTLNRVRRRFERDAAAFSAIYDEDRGGFHSWFNRAFRKPVFERYEKCFQAMGSPAGKTLLDIGCGSAIYIVNFLLKGGKAALGLDFSAPMLESRGAGRKNAGLPKHAGYNWATLWRWPCRNSLTTASPWVCSINCLSLSRFWQK